MQALHRILNPVDVVSAFQRGSAYEIITGMHPFKLTIPSKGLLKRSFSPIGFLFGCLHLLIFILANFFVMLIYDEQPVTIFMDSLLAYIQTCLLQWLQFFNTILIFFCNFVYYDRDSKFISKLQLVDNHMEAHGFNMPQFYRQAVRSMFLILMLAILVIVGLLVQGFYFYSRVVEEQYLLFYGIAFVMPSIYIQVQLVQFITLLTFQIVLSRQLNSMLLKVLRIAIQEDGSDTE